MDYIVQAQISNDIRFLGSNHSIIILSYSEIELIDDFEGQLNLKLKIN